MGHRVWVKFELIEDKSILFICSLNKSLNHIGIVFILPRPHHIFEKQYGGKVSIENGANLAAYNHEWLHEQTPEVKEAINRQLQEFKRQLDVTQIKVTDKGLDIQKSSRLEFDMSDCIEIPLYENIKESSPKHSFNRAKTKRETMKMIEEELDR